MNIPKVMSGQTGWMNRDVRKNQSSTHGRIAVVKKCTTNIFKVFRKMFQGCDIVVAPYQYLATLKPVQDLQTRLGDNNVTEMIHGIPVVDDTIPILYHQLIHLLNAREGPQTFAIRLQEGQALDMSPMGIPDYKSAHF